MKSETVRLFQTLPHPCGYYAERTAQNLVIDPAAPHLAQIYNHALTRGYRRAGGHVYHPHCPQCRACVYRRAYRSPSSCPDRTQRRCLERNRDLVSSTVSARYSQEYFGLYQRYLDVRHPGGGMDHPDPQDFTRFLYTAWSPTFFLEFRLEGRLLGVAVTDITASGLSAVYTFYDPTESTRSLGTYAILRQIELARERALPHLYLGYWIQNHPKMDYKKRFRPIELLTAEVLERHDGSA